MNPEIEAFLDLRDEFGITYRNRFAALIEQEPERVIQKLAAFELLKEAAEKTLDKLQPLSYLPKCPELDREPRDVPH